MTRPLNPVEPAEPAVFCEACHARLLETSVSGYCGFCEIETGFSDEGTQGEEQLPQRTVSLGRDTPKSGAHAGTTGL